MKELFLLLFVSLPEIHGRVLTRAGKSYDAGIIGGKDAPDSGIPYQVSLRTKDGTHWCGGSILNDRWILTATHCLDEIHTVVAGSNYISKGGDAYEIIEKKEYKDPSTDKFLDIALVKVDKDIKFSDRVQPVKLPTEDIGGDVNVMVSGWGAWKRENFVDVPDMLQVLNVTTLTVEKCKAIWGSDGLGYHEDNICTIDINGGSACKGDSGGPLVEGDHVVGIVSWGEGFCPKGYTNVFVRVFSYLDWINKIIKN